MAAARRQTRSGQDVGEVPQEVADVCSAGRAAWPRFIEAYSPFILACARRLANDYDERMEIYAHVCGRLYADDCRRVKQFRGSGQFGACKFTTWLAVVVQNLGREWIRGKRGRRRLYRRIRELPRVDRLIFRYRFWEGFDFREISGLLSTNHRIAVSEADVADAVGRMRRSLKRDQVWRLLARDRRHTKAPSLDGPVPALEPRCDGPLPIESLSTERAVRLLREAISRLPPTERRVLELKYQEGMPARAIAEQLEIRNYKRVYELQARAILRLRRRLAGHGVGLEDFGRIPGSLELGQ